MLSDIVALFCGCKCTANLHSYRKKRKISHEGLPWEGQTGTKRAATLATPESGIGSVTDFAMSAAQFILSGNPATPQRVAAIQIVGNVTPKNRHVVPMREEIIHTIILAVKAGTTYDGL